MGFLFHPNLTTGLIPSPSRKVHSKRFHAQQLFILPKQNKLELLMKKKVSLYIQTKSTESIGGPVACQEKLQILLDSIESMKRNQQLLEKIDSALEELFA
jgi:hypothetical protein